MATNALADSMDVLTDVDAWLQAAAVGGGYAGSGIVDAAITGMAPGPDEVAGVGAGAVVAAGSYAFAPRSYRNSLVTGGLLYAIGSGAEWAGFKEPVLSLGSDL